MLFKEKEIKPLHLKMENMCEKGDTLWFTSFYFNALYKMKKIDVRTTFVCSFPEEKASLRMYSKIVAHGDVFYCIPYSADSIGVYDAERAECKSLKIDMPTMSGGVNYRPDAKFFDAYCDDKYLYMFPHTYPAVVRLNLANHEIDYFYHTLTEMEKDIVNDNFYFSKICDFGDKKIMFCNASKKIYFFDSSKMMFQEWFSMKQEEGAITLAVAGQYAWLFSNYNREIRKINLVDKEVKTIRDLPKELSYGSFPVTRTAIYNGFVYFVPGTANKPIKVNMDTDDVSIATEILPEEFMPEANREVWKFSLLEVLGNQLFAYDDVARQLIKYDAPNNKVTKDYILSDVNSRSGKNVIREQLLLDGKITDLKSYLEYMKR
ncbi:MAG: hypothetical protein HFI64_12600 [Lachnospiraceae bacterium]|nr:hypothetical protein [Lachnospiraceae bacterium]